MKNRKQMWRKKCVLVLAMLVMAAGLTACGAQKLGDAFDEAAVKETAETIIGYINEDDIEGFCNVQMSEKMQEVTTVESMTEVFDQYIKDRGAFVEYKNNVVVGSTDDNGNECAVAVLVAKYENQTVNYTISFDADMNMIGFYLK